MAAAALGTVMATNTAVLFADTAVPVWHGARKELPFVFAACAAASAGALLAGALCERWAVYRAGFISARDPKCTVGPQRARADAARSTSG